MDRPSPIFLNTQLRIGRHSDSAVLLLIRDDHLLKVTLHLGRSSLRTNPALLSIRLNSS